MASSANEILRIEDGLRLKLTTLSMSGTIPRRVAIIRADATAGAFSLTLPVASLNPGQFLMVKKVDSTASIVTVLGDTTLPDLIDGKASVALTSQHESITLYSDGTNWMNATPVASGVFDSLIVNQPADITTGAPVAIESLIGGAHTGVLVEQNDVSINLARTVTFADGAALSTQRAMLIQAPTYAASVAKTITTAATLAISGAPSQGTNVTITNAYALWVQGGSAAFAGSILSTSTTAFSTALQLGASQKFTYDAANSTGLMNGASAQTFSVYNTFTAGTPDYERLELTWSANLGILRTTKSGTGTARSLLIQTSGGASRAIDIGTTVIGGLHFSGSASSAAGTNATFSNGQGRTALSGTNIETLWNPSYSDGGTNSTTVSNTVSFAPTINMTGASRTGKNVLAYFNPTLTSVPSGSNAGISFSAAFTNASFPAMRFHNVADEDTNWENVEMGWHLNANQFNIRMRKGGSGVIRAIQFLYSDANAAAVGFNGITSAIDLSNAAFSAAVSSGRVALGRASVITATSGTHPELLITAGGGPAPTSTSTLAWRGVSVEPTINYSNGTPGAGYVQLVRIAPINTALPTGRSSGLNFASTASGLTAAMSFENQTDDQTNFESLSMGFASNVFTISSVKGGSGTVRDIRMAIGGVNKIRLDSNANVILADSGSALATGATNGFVYVPNCAGTPTGVPASLPTGATPMIYDTTANKIWFYNGSWRGVLVA